jgi:signal transduction histidine kinase
MGDKSEDNILIIKKLNGFGLNNYTLKKIYFNVPPVWYETIWAYLVFISALILVVYFYVVYRLRKVSRENKRLEETVLSRTRSLKNALTELEDSKNQMSGQVHVMSRLLASISHDVQSPLHFIASASGDIPDLVWQGELDNISRLGIMISDLSEKTSNLLEDLLSYVKIQVYGNSMHLEQINLKDLIDSKLELFKRVIVRKGNRVVNEVPDRTEVTGDYLLLSIVVHNLIDNAIKYTSEGEIRISAKVINGNITELVISNIGSGIPQKIIDIINAPDGKKFHEHAIRNTKITGWGLLIVKEVADLIGVTLRVNQTDLVSFYLTWDTKSELGQRVTY